jgi:predicted ribonuclease YlaK
MARDLIAIMDDISADSFALEVSIVLPADVQSELDSSARLRADAARSQAQAAAAARRAARRLREQGLPLQDVGRALGVSFQRAKQLIDEADKLAS